MEFIFQTWETVCKHTRASGVRNAMSEEMETGWGNPAQKSLSQEVTLKPTPK